MSYLFVGAPAVGKGTQAKRLAAALHIPHISTGDMLRAVAQEKTDLGRKVKTFIDRGSLVPDEVMMALIEDRFSAGDTAGGYILDGFPRTLAQAMGLDLLLARLGQPIRRVILFECPDPVIVERIVERRSCPKCGTPYHTRWQPPANDNVCDRDGTPLVQRVDDTKTKVYHRLSQYRSETQAVIPHYEKRGLVRRVQASQSPDAVYRDVEAAVAKE